MGDFGDALIGIKGYPMYLLDAETLKVVSFYKDPEGKYRVLERNDMGVEGYTLYNAGKRKFHSLEKLRGTVELHKLKLLVKENEQVRTNSSGSVCGVIAKGDLFIGSIHKVTGHFSAVALPAKHRTKEAAKGEAARLAKMFTDKKFVVLRAEEVVSASEIIWE